ncbi:Protein CBR-SRI-2 [Caenorhabditis briggsae]|uniref:Uncharacterized protein n=2 Tax=Caenorhabditis briggsae TaxID=6238 RepID=A0AAE9F863_CAEBR|nr:Protein CBR-SRI-2 [Caenorhabditis briggsae]UMM37402.1 hypothetical protein L5515_009170 [Caenorhabditis briggsae]CAP25502.2 Protein CBR-SRI-2 [Caenorhabditis briggsae]
MPIEVGPNWYIYSMHFTAIITTPINIIGVLIILFCQKSQLASLRWHLLTFQICSLTSDFFINIGTLPVIYSPFPIGRPHGILTHIFQFLGFQKSTEAQCIMVFVSLYITAGSVELLFFLRYQIILPMNHKHKLSTFSSVILVFLYQVFLITMMIISFHYAVPDQEVAKAQFARLYPELQYLIIDEHVYFVCVIVELKHALFLASCFLRLALGLATVILLIWLSNRSLHRFDLSVKTRKIHLQLIKSLCYQISIPIVAFYVPLLAVIGPLMFSIPNTQSEFFQIIFFISLIFCSLHTFLGTLSMMYFNRHYRLWLISTVKNKSFTTTLPTSKFLVAKDNASRIASAMF